MKRAILRILYILMVLFGLFAIYTFVFISREGVLTKAALIAIAIGIILSGISGILNSNGKKLRKENKDNEDRNS